MTSLVHVMALVMLTIGTSRVPIAFALPYSIPVHKLSSSFFATHHRTHQQHTATGSSLSATVLEVLSPSSSFHCYSSKDPDPNVAANELLEEWKSPREQDQQGLAFLFVSQYHAQRFEDIVKVVSKGLGGQTKLLSLIGGGCIDGDREVDDPSEPFLSLLGGILPPKTDAQVTLYNLNAEDDESRKIPSSALSSTSHIVLSDPFCTKITQTLQLLDDKAGADRGGSVVVGGISVPQTMTQSSIGIQDKVLPPGSLAGVSLSGTIGLQAIVAQGCRPVGPTFTISKIRANAIAELDSKPAIEQLEKVVEEATEEDQALVRSFGVLGGVIHQNRKNSKEEMHTDVGDFLIRQVIGFRPQSGAFLVAGGHQLKEGDCFRFHVRAPDAALEDMQLMVQRAKTERLVLGSQTLGRPIGALQISCVARGRSLYGRPNVDLDLVKGLFDGSENDNMEISSSSNSEEDDDDDDDTNKAPPIAGFFANGEIGPVGIINSRPTDDTSLQAEKSTHLHGFTTVVCLLCEHRKQQEPSLLGAGDHTAIDDAWG